VSRNAVIGKANRLGFSPFKSATAGQHERTGAPNIARPRIATQHRTLLALRTKPQLAFAEVPGDDANRCSLFELQQWHCRWPIGDPTVEDFGFCGNKAVDGLPYCPAHARIAYRPGTREPVVRELRCLA
jgi:GcrA cell cycle regulator